MKPHEVKPSSYVRDLLGPGGWFEQEIPGYRAREEQIRLAEAFANFLLFTNHPIHTNLTPFISEAPCGTGKTFAYLVPLLYHTAALVREDKCRKDVFISTGGISLQEQLLLKDIPNVLRVMEPFLGVPVTTLVLKGVSNYICPKAIEDNEREIEDLLQEPGAAQEQAAMDAYHSKGVADLSLAPPPGPRLLPLVTTTNDDCWGAKCPVVQHGGFCRYLHDRRLAMGEGLAGHLVLVVTNHHALVVHRQAIFARGFQRPFILADEAHELPGIYRNLTTSVMNQETWTSLLNKILKDLSKEREVDPSVPEAVLELQQKDVFCGIETPDLGTEKAVPVHQEDLVSDAVRKLRYLVERYGEYYRYKIERFAKPLQASEKYFRLWVRSSKGLSLVSLKTQLRPIADAHFSATLRYLGKYDHYLNQYRSPQPLQDTSPPAYRYTACSPFDWQRQCLVVFPRKYEALSHTKMDDRTYQTHLGSAVEEIVLLSKGRSMVICSSWNSANQIAGRLRNKVPYRVLLQGEMGKQQLVQEFKKDVSSILVGTLSFWTGVDVPGEALSTLVIDKIPFRGGLDYYAEILKHQKKNWFLSHTLVEATTLLAQGFGRLIRSTEDRGVCVILDSRIFPFGKNKARYAEDVLATVFPETCNFTDDLDDIPRFLEAEV